MKTKVMNWKEIKKKYPKAWMLLMEWFWYKKNITLGIELSRIFMPERKLYDFFDEQKTFIVINHYWMHNYRNDDDSGETFKTKGRLHWSFQIFSFRMPNFESRIEAEQAAFLKAFEILEKKL